jgi:uncharacterized protein (TIGR02757 family)
MNRTELREQLDALHARLNRREFVSPDPLEVVYRYESNADREVVGLIAACLAYGRVAQILRNLDALLACLGPHPAASVREGGAQLAARLNGFQHRWTTRDEVAALFEGIASALREHNSLEACFLSHQRGNTELSLPGLIGFTRELRLGREPDSLLSAPEKGSACKRLHLYLRWMARRDDVDPGCWTRLRTDLLIVPLDTHMHRAARAMRLTRRKQANLAAALDITAAFRSMNPNDPLKYDFALTRLGIRADEDMHEFIRSLRNRPRAA